MGTGVRAASGLAVVLVALLVSCGQDGGTGSDSTEATTVVPSPETAVTTTNQAPLLTTADPTSTSTTATSPNDPANTYLGRTTEIYRRALPDGQDFVVRLSTESYATVFGLTWNAPTGSAEECLGDHAVFLGVPGDVGPWGSAWVATSWFDETSRSQPVMLQSSMWAADSAIPRTEYLVVRTDSDAREVVLTSMDGIELDRSAVVNGVAMVAVDHHARGADRAVNDRRVTVVAKDGRPSAPSPLVPAAGNVRSACGPGEPPSRPLPERRGQPGDPARAETQIRQRHALLVDRSVPTDQRLADVLDDDTGVQDAIVHLDASQYRDIAASATYSIDELVFTQPDEAWFRYTIATVTETYSDRFGIAVFNGAVWQITRATICQDLALALSPCQPTSKVIEPPSTPEWQAAWQEWMSRANLYNANDGCGPLSQC